MAFYQAMSWHEGEDKIHKLTKVPPSDNPTQPMLAQSSARRVAASPLIALGTIDDQDRVWCTVWGGDVPIAQPVAPGGVIGIRTQVDASFDPVVEALYGGRDDGEVVRHDPRKGQMVSGLSIHLEERDRLKLFGRMLAGSLNADEVQPDTEGMVGTYRDSKEDSGRKGKTGSAQLVLQITQSLGNCPKYLNKKSIASYAGAKPRLVSESTLLSDEAVSHIHAADLFFVASRGPDDMDCNHRGGPPGFIRVQQPTTPSSSASSVLVWPEYSGNNLYQTLGNIIYTPSTGIVIPNFDNGDVLYLNGTSEILVDAAAVSVISKTRLAVGFTVTAARFVKDGLSFRGTLCSDNKDVSSSHPISSRAITDGRSPYNPRVRYLTSESISDKNSSISTLPPDENRDRSAPSTNDTELTATLVRKTSLTPTITKYRFSLSSSNPTSFDPTMSPLWQPGQYIALDFSEELYMGYSHMRDDDPTSLNDDFIRTFTIANIFEPPPSTGQDPEFEIVIRNVGTVTRWLSWQNDRNGRTKLGVTGFGGNFRFEVPDMAQAIRDENGDGKKRVEEKIVFVAAGVGITPLLGQISKVEEGDKLGVAERLIVLWTVHVKDVGLVVEVLGSMPEVMKKSLRVFVTGVTDGMRDEENVATLAKLEEAALQDGVGIHRRRLTRGDLMAVEEDGEVHVKNWYLCSAPSMRRDLQEWLGGRTLVFENFDY